MRNYKNLTETITRRLNPESLPFEKQAQVEFSSIAYSDVLTFVRTAMKGVEPEYTRRSRDAGNRVKAHLEKVLSSVSYRYQGSVTTNTHIKGFSDIDLVVISEKFYGWERTNILDILAKPERREKYQKGSIDLFEKEASGNVYSGNSIADLRENRLLSEAELSQVYSEYELTKPKSIKIKNLSLNREVDVVIAGWYDDARSVINGKGDYRGVKIFNKETNSQESEDYPFLRAKYIEEKNSRVNGRLKRMIRFSKNCKALSSNDINLSSFDINSICYDIPESDYSSLNFYQLVPIIYNQLKAITESDSKADSITSIDNVEYIFRGKPEKVEAVRILLLEVESIFVDLNQL